MRTLQRFIQLELRAPADNDLAVRNIALQYLAKVQHSRPALDKREHYDAERRLKLSVFKKLI